MGAYVHTILIQDFVVIVNNGKYKHAILCFYLPSLCLFSPLLLFLLPGNVSIFCFIS